MPLYEYVCSDCDTQSELLVMGREKPECPSCHSAKMERLFSLPARPVMAPTSGGGCDTSLPPCNPHCCRLPQGG
jgi:putative FmdB family regulatory protein